MRFGIPENSLNIIISTLQDFDSIRKASIFGSRALGNYKNGSDVDIAIYGDDITSEIVNRLSILLNEDLPLPYYFDIVHYEGLDNNGLKEHINSFSVSFYEKVGNN